MAAMYIHIYMLRDPISAVTTNEQLLVEKRTAAKFQIDIFLKTERLDCIYTDLLFNNQINNTG